MPYMVQELVKSAGKSSKYGVQIMNGAPLWMNFDDYSKSEGTPYPKAFPDVHQHTSSLNSNDLKFHPNPMAFPDVINIFHR